MNSNEFQVKIEELKKLHKEAQSKANQIEDQISKLQDKHKKLLMDNLRSNFVNKYFKLENKFVTPDYFYIRNVYPHEYSYDDICFVGDRISPYDGTYHEELYIAINSEWGYIKTENLVEIRKEEFMTAYDKACKEMLSRGLGEPINISNKLKGENTMKAFDLELAKKGFPVCTRDGRDARIICFDRDDSTAPIVALIKDGEHEGVWFYRENGTPTLSGGDTSLDLVMKTAQHTGWVNLYRGTNKTVFCGHRVYESEKAALAGKKGKYEYVASQQVTWDD